MNYLLAIAIIIITRAILISIDGICKHSVEIEDSDNVMAN